MDEQELDLFEISATLPAELGKSPTEIMRANAFDFNLTGRLGKDSTNRQPLKFVDSSASKWMSPKNERAQWLLHRRDCIPDYKRSFVLVAYASKRKLFLVNAAE